MPPRHGLLVLLSALAAGALAPGSAAAQFGIEKLFPPVTGIDFFWEVGRLTSPGTITTSDFLLPSPNGLRGWGVEALFDITPVDSAKRRPAWDLHLGLGYGYTTGFAATSPSLDLRGSVRDLPSIALYWKPKATAVYLGASVGFAQLWNVTAYDDQGRQYSVDGQAFSVGYSVAYERRGVFVEASWRIRDFRSVQWKFPAGVSALPNGWPRNIDLSAITVTIGYEVRFPAKSDEPKCEPKCAPKP